jgi:flagellar motor protein MotB
VNQFSRPRSAPRKTEWETIYMDLMTTIMVFFVILWSINQGSSEGVTKTIGDQTTRMINLPADILFTPGRSAMTDQGKSVFAELFAQEGGSVLNFDTGGLTRRMLVVHGHTDNDGQKDSNFALGYQRAFAAYQEIAKHSPEVADNIILCSHASNSPQQETPVFQGQMTAAQRQVLREAKSKNRRITIEDKVVSTLTEEEE